MTEADLSNSANNIPSGNVLDIIEVKERVSQMFKGQNIEIVVANSKMALLKAGKRIRLLSFLSDMFDSDFCLVTQKMDGSFLLEKFESLDDSIKKYSEYLLSSDTLSIEDLEVFKTIKDKKIPCKVIQKHIINSLKNSNSFDEALEIVISKIANFSVFLSEINGQIDLSAAISEVFNKEAQLLPKFSEGIRDFIFSHRPSAKSTAFFLDKQISKLVVEPDKKIDKYIFKLDSSMRELKNYIALNMEWADINPDILVPLLDKTSDLITEDSMWESAINEAVEKYEISRDIIDTINRWRFKKKNKSILPFLQRSFAGWTSWIVTSRQELSNPRIHAGEKFRYKGVKSVLEIRNSIDNRNAFIIGSLGNVTFVSDRLEKGDKDYQYQDLKCEIQHLNLSTEGFDDPRDANLTGHIWKVLSEVGGPDRKHNDNGLIPVYEYYYLTVSHGGKEILSILFSTEFCAKNFEKFLTAMKEFNVGTPEPKVQDKVEREVLVIEKVTAPVIPSGAEASLEQKAQTIENFEIPNELPELIAGEEPTTAFESFRERIQGLSKGTRDMVIKILSFEPNTDIPITNTDIPLFKVISLVSKITYLHQPLMKLNHGDDSTIVWGNGFDEVTIMQLTEFVRRYEASSQN